MAEKNQRIVLASRPQGWVSEENFRLEEAPVPEPKDGEALVRNHYMSLDPYMRGRMNASKSYSASVEIGQTMVGGTVGEVVKSNDPSLKPGDKVVGQLGWQLYGTGPAKAFMKVDTGRVPLSAYLGPVGMPGVTAWIGTYDICQPKAGETLVVNAASGAVGGVVGQLAKMKGARVVGIAGGAAKVKHVVDDLGFDACVDYRAASFRDDFKAATPKGVDCLFENVGGEVMETVVARFNPFARMALCGLVSQYNETEPQGLKTLFSILVNRVTMRGFIVSDHMEKWPQALAELGAGVATGKIKYRETVAEGLANAPKAFIGMLKGQNLGKQLVRLA
ncbi:NADP-dependent oxidoreductase [Desertibaculum subflavum]|uniref:NADP-dependent oxidoreductase n=1 Tax=Desertibaculum subflavum TaxID=2268458 RepID=UPI000E6622C6